jgi:hypothetical protein
MRKIMMAMVALVVVAISSCTETTDLMGNSLTRAIDQFDVVTDTFDVSTKSLKVDSVFQKAFTAILED